MVFVLVYRCLGSKHDGYGFNEPAYISLESDIQDPL